MMILCFFNLIIPLKKLIPVFLLLNYLNIMDSPTPTILYTQFYNVLITLRNMPYYANGAAESGNVHGDSKHEAIIKAALEGHEFVATQKPNGSTKEVCRSWVENTQNCPMEIGTFIEQPCGKQDSPDFLVRISKDCVIALEAKSSKNTTPLYNSAGIKNDYIYIFCSKKHNATTFYWGRDIITPEQQETLSELFRLQKEIEEVQNKLLNEQDTNGRGIYYYTRAMIGQRGGAQKTDYFIHNDRVRCEENVLAFFKNHK